MAGIMLTDDLLRLIFKHVNVHHYVLEWKAYLPLLAVSSQWRNQAVPLAYGCLWIYQNSPTNAPHTNASLVNTLGFQTHVNKLYIATAQDAQIATLQSTVALLQPFHKLWPTIHTLHYTLKLTSSISRRSYPGYHQYTDMIGGLVRKLTHMLPNISTLQLHSGWNKLTRNIAGRLAKAYSNQTTTLECSFPTNVAGQTCFANLTQLDISLNEASRDFMPKIPVLSLKKLILHNVSRGFSWQCFSRHMKPQVVEFPELLELTVIHQTNREPNNNTQKPSHICLLHFPRLLKLSMSACHDTYPVLETTTFGANLQHMHLRGNHTSLSSLSAITLPSAIYLSLDICKTDELDMWNYLQLVNHIDSQAKCSMDTRLIINRASTINLPGQFACPTLTHLAIKADLTIPKVLHIINSLPNLKELELLAVIAHRNMLNKYAPILDSSINTLVFDYNRTYCYESDALVVFKHLLVGLPHLIKVVAKSMAADAVNKYVGEQKSTYSCLAHVDFTLNQSDVLPLQFSIKSVD